MKKGQAKKFNNSKIFLVLTFFLLLGIFLKGALIALSPVVDNTNLQEFAKRRTTRDLVLPASRGTIYDNVGNVLAQDVSAYTLIAYLDETRTTNPKKPQHIVDIQHTAEQLATVLDIEEEQLVAYLSKNEVNPNIKQTEFGNAGRGLTEITKDEILALGLPGIGFIETSKRYYPNGDFLAYALGYAKSEPDGSIVGEMGLEKAYNDVLTGTSGSKSYQKDLRGYKIPNTKEYVVPAQEGKDIHLTINNNIQLFVEQAIKTSKEKYSFQEMTVIVAGAKTGEILAMSNYPSFNPNTRNIINYLDPNANLTIEPGSTMKIYTYMAAMEAGKYKGDATFKSGTVTTKDDTEIGDYDRRGWGTITFDAGFARSSNVGIVHLLRDYIDAKTLRNYLTKLGFGQKTGIELHNESTGKIDFKYETEIYNAGFGQGITTTAMQNIKALTAVSNNGVLLQPYLIKKIVDPITGEVILENNKKEIERVASIETVSKIKSLMKDVIEVGTGSPYKMEGYDIIAKTGTAQIPKTDGRGGYETSAYSVIRGFSGVYPANDPEIIIYATVTKPTQVASIASVVKEVIINTSKFLGLDKDTETEEVKVSNYKITSLKNKSLIASQDLLLKENIEPLVIGNGDIVIDQYPKVGTLVDKSDLIVLRTNSTEYQMPNLYNYSKKQVSIINKYLDLKLIYNGTGYVKNQSIKPGTKINKNDELTLDLNYNLSK